MFKRQLILLLLFGFTMSAKAQVTFVISSLPATTPKSDTIFITGTFNNWEVNDPRYMLHKQHDGRFAITLPHSNKTFEYKFTRGSWTKVETDERNSYIANRIYAGGKIVHVDISNWLDLGGAQAFPYKIFYFFAVALGTVFLLIAAFRLKKKASIKFKAFALFNASLTLLFLGVVAYQLVNLIQQTYLTLLLKTIFFLWGPIVLALSTCLKTGEWPRRYILHFIPAGLATLLFLAGTFGSKALSLLPKSGDTSWIVAGIVFNLLYFVVLFSRSLSPQDEHTHPSAKFIRWLLTVQLIVIAVLIANLLLLSPAFSFGFLPNYDIAFLALSLAPVAEGLFLWKHAEIFYDKPTPPPIDHMDELKERIGLWMSEKKPFKNPELNIDLLAKEMGMKPHVLSKILNEGFQKNFRDFVNCYRIEEFIRLAAKGKLENYTYLAIAYEAGFNSKSTFNLAFKKFTRKSPREYFQTQKSLMRSSAKA